jgi:cytochrome oxidase Cu insertion factor (SCO1/SenC/PrrC family)
MINSLTGWAVACGMVALGAAFQQTPPPAQPPPPLVPTLKVGDLAPAFALQGSDGKVHTLSSYKGKTVVLAWFPKAFTGG